MDNRFDFNSYNLSLLGFSCNTFSFWNVINIMRIVFDLL